MTHSFDTFFSVSPNVCCSALSSLLSLTTMYGLLTLTLVISHLALVQAGFPTDPCWLEDKACVIGPDNLLSSLLEVPDVATCRQLCQDNQGCSFFSYFGPESFPLKKLCLLLSSCDSLHPCEDCRTEEISCFTPCGFQVQGEITDNLLDIITGVPTEIDCKFNCSAKPDCNVYTYFNTEDVNFPSLCFLLSQLVQPVQHCDHCSTGWPDCRNTTGEICAFSVGADNTGLTSYKFTETGDTPVNILSLGDCELTVVAVGGGGGSADNYRGGAGGSGYVVVSSTIVTVPASELLVRVGGPGQLTSMETSEGETIVTAQHGGHGSDDYHYGGAGYSGGGGGGYSSGAGGYSSGAGGEGGEDGGDGGDSSDGALGSGGAGSGLNISSIIMEIFSLSPGAGGKRDGRYGGGGGGILVDNSGPQETEYDGQGYGGGGGGYHNNPGPGLVLLEIKPKL